MKNKTQEFINDFLVENHITDYNLMKDIINIVLLEEKLLAAEKELNINE